MTAPLTLEDVREFFQTEHIRFLKSEEAVCFIFAKLLDGENYGSGLEADLSAEYPFLSLSDTVLYRALACLVSGGLIESRHQALGTRGRSRTMYSLTKAGQDVAQEFADHWEHKFRGEKV